MALNSMNKNKTPGNGGLTVEFYQTFWHEVGHYVINSLNEAKEKGHLSHSQSQGVITLIEKKDKDKRYISNWRPITLLNTDYKLAARCIAKRMDKFLENLISVSQTAFVKNRSIGQCVRLIDGLMNYTKDIDTTGVLIAVDFQKAFDSLEWRFMFKSLQNFNFGPSLIEWVRIFYHNPSSCVMNRGLSTKYFDLTRGVRQGDPLSLILFILSLEAFFN